MEGVIGYVTLFAGNYAPTGWAFCDGSPLYINQYSALYGLIGLTYGGDGKTTFNLPDLRGRTVVGVGQGDGLKLYKPGQKAGAESVTLSYPNIQHSHGITMTAQIPVNDSISNQTVPGGFVYGYDSNGVGAYSTQPAGVSAPMDISIITDYTGSATPAPMPTRSACLALNYIICIAGDYPPPAPGEDS